MKLATTIKNALATVTDKLAEVAQHLPPFTPSITLTNPAIGTIVLTPSAPIALAPKPPTCSHCGK